MTDDQTYRSTVANAEEPLRPAAAAFTSTYAYWMIFVFFLVNLISQMDGVVLAILAEPIRRELKLNDSQLGLLRFAFSAFYALFGLAIGRLADTWIRARMLSIAVAMFSVATVACGMTNNFIQLFIARVFVGVGEAGGVPTKYSMVGDVFPPDRRARALALIQAGLGVGSLAGLMLAGYLADTVGWRQTFYLFGVPGLVLAVLIALTIREPARGRFEAARPSAEKAQPLRVVLGSLVRNRTFVYIVFAYSATTFGLTGIGYWMPSFIVRSYGLTLTQVGLYYGSISGLGFIAGLVLGAIFSPRLLRGDRAWEMRLPGLVNLVVAAIYFTMFALTTSATAIFALAGCTSFLLGVTTGPASAAIQSTITARTRGMAVAITMFVSSLIGQGLAPWLIGFASDFLKPAYGPDSLRVALAVSPVVFVVGGILYLLGVKHFHDNRVD